MNMRKNCIGPRTNLAKPAIAALLALTLASGAAAQCPPGPPPTACEPDPIPSGANESPSNNFSIGEYAFVHSSTNLQAEPAHMKFAAGLFWNPAGEFGTGVPRAFGAFSSAIIVNNPSPASNAVVRIEYNDPAGNLLGTSASIVIPPDGTHIEAASKIGLSPAGIGSATIIVENPQETLGIVGSTVHYFDSIAIPGWGVVEDPDKLTLPSGETILAPGEGSYQQLQKVPTQEFEKGGFDWRGWHFAGPFRFSNMSVNDFDNGSAPILMVANPNDHPVPVVFATLVVGPGGVIANLGGTDHTLAPHGMVMETKLWNGLNQLTRNFLGIYDFDIIVAVVAIDGSPLVGDALVIDAFGDDEGGTSNRNLNLGTRMRMVSTSISGAPGAATSGPLGFSYRNTLYASDVSTYSPSDGTAPMIRTGIKVANASFVPTSQITVEYFDHDGTPLATDCVPTLAPFATLQIGLGEAQTPNFPANMWNGSVRVRSACSQERLIGWTAREICKAPPSWPTGYQYFKAYGEEMTGANGDEPGIAGYPVEIGGAMVARRVASLVQTRTFGNPNYWPGYTTFTVGLNAANNGWYQYRFMNGLGNDLTNYADQPFDGLRFGASSLTYEDSDPLPSGPISQMLGLGSGKVDTLGSVSFTHGINVLGGTFAAYEIGMFARRYLGPQDIVPPVELDWSDERSDVEPVAGD